MMASVEYRGFSKRSGMHSYRVVVSGGYGADLKQKKIQRLFKYPNTMTEKSRENAVRKEAAMLEMQYRAGSVSTGKDYKLSEYAEYFLDNLSPSTVTWYEDMLRLRIIPAMGSKRLSQIRPADINTFIKNLSKNGRSQRRGRPLSSSSIKAHYACLSTMFSQAVYWEFIPYSPCGKVKPPQLKHVEMRFLSDNQSLIFLEALNSEEIKYQAAALIAIFSGMRRGEIAGLHWDDIDFINKTISIKRTRKHIRGVGYVDKDTKTESSKRTNSLPATVFSALASLKMEQNTKAIKLKGKWVDDPHVFKQWNGLAMTDDALYQWLKKFIQRIRKAQVEAASKDGREIDQSELFPDIRFHDLRHTNAALLIAEGVDIQIIKKRLGHAQATTTLNMYGHSLDERDIKASEKLENLLIGKTIIPK